MDIFFGEDGGRHEISLTESLVNAWYEHTKTYKVGYTGEVLGYRGVGGGGRRLWWCV